jgi:hypothetical protein
MAKLPLRLRLRSSSTPANVGPAGSVPTASYRLPARRLKQTVGVGQLLEGFVDAGEGFTAGARGLEGAAHVDQRNLLAGSATPGSCSTGTHGLSRPARAWQLPTRYA